MRYPPVWICWNYRRRLLSDVCIDIGAGFDLVRGRLLSGWHIERALYAPPGALRDAEPEPALRVDDSPVRTPPLVWVDWHGQRRRLVDVCFDHRIDIEIVRNRVRRGWTLADAVEIKRGGRRPGASSAD